MTERRHRVVVVGGGFGGLNATRALAKADVDVTVVDRTNHHLFQPLLYQVAAGILPEGLVAPALRSVIKKQANARALLAEVTNMDLEHKVVHAVAPDYPGGCLDHPTGEGWYEASVASGGTYLSSCATDWAEGLLDAIGGEPWDGDIELERWPDAATVTVYVDGVAETDGWTYADADNAVQFAADHLPEPGSVVTVTYALNCPD